MKKFLIIILSLLLGCQLFGQNGIYDKIKYLDKFDDEIKAENVKTIIERTDSTFVVETKGKEPIEYVCVMNNVFNSAGSDDETINLFDNVYGYQESWYVMTRKDFNEWRNGALPAEQFLLVIVHRVIKTQYTHDFVSELFWVQDSKNSKLGKNINRIIYIR